MLDHQFINDLEPFRTVNPSAENLAKYFYDEMTARQLRTCRPGARITDAIDLGNGYEPARNTPALIGVSSAKAEPVNQNEIQQDGKE